MTNGLTVAAPFGGGGVSDVTYDIANAEEMQVLISGGLGEAETGGPSINIVPKSGGNQFRGAAFYSTSGDWATSNNVDDQLRSVGITQPPTLRTNWDASGSLGGPIKRDRLWFFANVRDWANAAVVDGIFANRFAGDASHWDYAADPSIEARVGGIAEDLRGPSDGPAHAAQPRDVLARLPAPVRGIVAEAKAATAAVRRAAIGSRPGGRSAPIPCRRKHSPATMTSRTTPRRPRIRPRSAAACCSKAGYSRFAYGYARFGMAAPDGLMDLIPVTEADRHLRASAVLLSRGVRSARLRLQRQRRAADRLARGDVLRHRRAQHEDWLLRATSRTCTTDACRTTRSCATRSTTRCRSASRISSSPRWDQHDRTRDARAVRTGPVDGRAADAAGRACGTIARGAGRRPTATAPPAPRASTRSRSRSIGRSASAATTTSRRASGVAYDLFGNGKTALKVNVGKYLEAATSDVIYSSNNPAARIVTRIGSRAGCGARLDRRQRQLRRRLRPAESAGAEQPRHRRRPVCGGRRRRPEFRQRQPEHHDHQSRDPRRLGRPSVRLAVRRLGAARAPAAAVDRGRLQPALVGKLLRDRQRADDGGGLRHLLASPFRSTTNLPGGGGTASFVAITPAASRAGRAELHDERDRLRRRAHGVLAGRGLHRDGAVGQRPHRAGRHQHRTRRSQQL